MLHVLSPAKSLDYTSEIPVQKATVPAHIEESAKLIHKLSKSSANKIKELMGISDKLVQLNLDRYRSWEGKKQADETARQALYAFSGDVYHGLDAYSLTAEQVNFAQDNLRILSGLYGILKPLDIIEAYRLEMGTQFSLGRNKNLYEFWGDSLTKDIEEEFQNRESKVLVNLASNEYFKVLQSKKRNFDIISPQFLDAKKGQYKIISFFAKKARGMMSRYIIENKIDNPADLIGFDAAGYRYNQQLSKPEKPVFTREENQS